MGDEQERPWVRIAGSIILGGCGVLAAMVPLYCSKQKSLETQVVKTQADQTQIDALQREIAQLQAAVSEKDAEIAKLKERPTPAANAGGSAGGIQHAALETPQLGPKEEAPAATRPIRSFTERGVVIQLKSCALSGSAVKCDLLFVSKELDRNVALKTGNLSRAIDESGRECFATFLALGAHNNGPFSSVESQLPADVPIGGQIQFDGVKPTTKKLQLLEIVLAVGDSSGWHDTVVKFANVEL